MALARHNVLYLYVVLLEILDFLHCCQVLDVSVSELPIRALAAGVDISNMNDWITLTIRERGRVPAQRRP